MYVYSSWQRNNRYCLKFQLCFFDKGRLSIQIIHKSLLICQSAQKFWAQYWLNFTWSHTERIFVWGICAVLLFDTNFNSNKLLYIWVVIALYLNSRIIETSKVFSVKLYEWFVFFIHGVKLTWVCIIETKFGIRT